MGMLTHSRVEIAAPAKDVFSWLVEPARLTAWLGGAGAMPDDTSLLHVGWTSTVEQAPIGKVGIEIVGWDPPTRLVYLSTFASGDAHTSYTLTEGDGHTTLECHGDTGWGRPEGGWGAVATHELVDQQLDEDQQLDHMETRLEAGAFGGLAHGQLQQALDASLQRLKGLIEAA